MIISVSLWFFLLAVVAITMSDRDEDQKPSIEPERPGMIGELKEEDYRLIQDELDRCGERLARFLAASDIGGRSPHVLGADETVRRMARFQQFTPIFPSTAKLENEFYDVLHTPAGRAIETRWRLGENERVEAVFFKESDEWKIDWDHYVHAGSESWPLFLAGRGKGRGDFRLLARERVGAKGRDAEFMGLVLYSPRSGYPEQAIAPSPEIRVKRQSPMGRRLAQAFEDRAKGLGAFGSRAVAGDPTDMIRVHVLVTREGEDERVFQIGELYDCHWLRLPTRKAETPRAKD